MSVHFFYFDVFVRAAVYKVKNKARGKQDAFVVCYRRGENG